MNIDKSKLKMGIWCEDADGNRVEHDSALVDYPKEADTVHVLFPLEVREEIYKLHDYEDGRHYMGKDKVCTFSTHIGGGNADVILAMANSGDYTLSEAIAVYATACERCANVLAYKYLNGKDGYPEYSDEWRECNTVCDFCRDTI